MSVAGRAGLFAALAAVAAALLFLTCRHDDLPSDDPGDEVAPSARPEPGAPGSARRAPRARAAREQPPPTEAPAAPVAAPTVRLVAASPAGFTPAAHGMLRVTVTCGGEPAPSVDVWLVREAGGGPGTAEPAQRRRFSDGAYFDLPMYVGLWATTDVPGDSVSFHARYGRPQARTDATGRAEISVEASVAYRVHVASDKDRVAAAPLRDVSVGEGSTRDVVVAARRMPRIAGRCLGFDEKPVAACWVQAVTDDGERPVSPLVTTDDDGRFALDVDPDVGVCRVRVVAARSAGTSLPLCDTEEALPPVEADTTLSGVVPGGEPLTLRLGRAATVVLDVTADVAFGDLQVEGLVWDDEAGAWGRLGGPAFRRVGLTSSRRATVGGKSPGGASFRAIASDAWRRGFAALPRTDAERPLKVWSWAATFTVVDPRGRDRVEVKLPSRRQISVTGDGWQARDRMRVIGFFGEPGAELPVIWIDGDDVTKRTEWHRDDAPPVPFEFQLLRDGRVLGRSARVPAGTMAAQTVRIDVVGSGLRPGR